MTNGPSAKWKVDGSGVTLAMFVSDKGRSSFILQKRYKDGEEWKESKYLSEADLLVVVNLCKQALRGDRSARPAQLPNQQKIVQAPKTDFSTSQVASASFGSDDDIPF